MKKWPVGGYFIGGELSIGLVNELLADINAQFARDFDSALFEQYSKLTFFPKLAASGRMKNHGTALGKLYGLGQYECKSAQIALRFPGQTDMAAHIDDIPCPDNGVIAGATPLCAAILGVYLSDVPARHYGALEVYPRSHLVVEMFGLQHGHKVLQQGVLPSLPSRPDIITGPKGTSFLLHPQIVHRVPRNDTPHIRYALYFRFYHPAKKVV